MNTIKRKVVAVLIIVFFACVPCTTNAQIDPGCNPDDPACPIDGGLSLLIAAGIGLGAKKTYNKKRRVVKES